MPQPLAGVRVLDLSRDVAGGYCTKLLADLGAEVIKVEPRDGDPTRFMQPFLDDVPGADRSGFAAFLHGNKRSVTLDPETASGRALLTQLAGGSDAVVDTFAAGERESLGLTTLRQRSGNAGLLSLSITPFGLTGPYAHFRATDIVDFALGGWMYAMGDPARPPLSPGVNYARMLAGLYAAAGLMVALEWADATGEGQDLEVSVMETVVSILPYDVSSFSYSGAMRERSGPIYFGNPLAALYPCADGFVQFQNQFPGKWEAMCQMMDRADLAGNPRFATPAARVANADELGAIIRGWLATRTRAEIFALAGEYRLIFSTVPSLDEVLHSAYMQARDYFVRIAHPVLGERTYPGAPYRFGNEGWHPGRAPLLGEHNREVFIDRLGLRAETLGAYGDAGII